MMINRELEDIIEGKIGSGKAIIVVGPRQVGKTTLIQTVLQSKKDVLFLNGDDPLVRQMMTNPNTEELKNLIGTHPYTFIDEAQRIENIGITLKIITDQIKHTQLFVSGSSAFDLSNKTKEPLTGRKWEYHLYPVSWREFERYVGPLKSRQQLPLRLVYGMYPEIVSHPGAERELLGHLADSYLYKDILMYNGIRKPELLEKLLRALAFQLGNEVSYNELSRLLGIDVKTVSSYVDLLVRAFVIFRLPSFSRNLRTEIKTNQKIYFYDNGVRNWLTGNLDPWEVRADKGALWENFMISERLKRNAYSQSLARSYFWRTRQQQEVDYVEDVGGNIFGYEFKWNPQARVRSPKTFTETYQAKMDVIHSGNFHNFLM
jgi:predicted AAA+ superfamily ATPase